jgi:leucyl aminopeptidase
VRDCQRLLQELGTADMKLTTIVAAACASAVLAKPEQVKPRALLTIEVAPGETRQITEDERWELAAVGDVVS